MQVRCARDKRHHVSPTPDRTGPVSDVPAGEVMGKFRCHVALLVFRSFSVALLHAFEMNRIAVALDSHAETRCVLLQKFHCTFTF
jgi:hypothetical protein